MHNHVCVYIVPMFMWCLRRGIQAGGQAPPACMYYALIFCVLVYILPNHSFVVDELHVSLHSGAERGSEEIVPATAEEARASCNGKATTR